MRRPADFLPMFGDLPPYRPPGGPLRYSNAGYVLLGLVIEELAGKPYVDVVGERVFDPAGMTASGFFPLDEVRPDMAVGYLSPTEPGGPWRSNIYSVPIVGGADGGSCCTAADLDRFLRRYDDGTLLGRELTGTMLTPRAPVEPGLDMGYGVFIHADRWGHGGGDPASRCWRTGCPTRTRPWSRSATSMASPATSATCWSRRSTPPPEPPHRRVDHRARTGRRSRAAAPGAAGVRWPASPRRGSTGETGDQRQRSKAHPPS